MNMSSISRCIAAIFLCLALSGCILQSKEPLFSDEQGELILETYGNRFATYSLEGNNWKKDDETISFAPVDKHYVMSIGNDKLIVTFAAIDVSWWAIQGQEEGKSFNYYLADAQNGEVLLYPLACTELQDAAKFGNFIDFKDSDCFVKNSVDAAAMFKALAAEPRQAKMKLVPVP